VGHAFVIAAPGLELRAEAVIAFCEGKLAGYKRPRYVTFCEELPRTSLGKVRKAVLLNGSHRPGVDDPDA